MLRFRRGLPDYVRAADKPGELEAVRNDSGIIYAQNRPFVLSVMATYLRREKDGEEAIAKIRSKGYFPTRVKEKAAKISNAQADKKKSKKK